MQIDAFTLAWLIGTSGLFTSITAIAVTWITKRSDERRHRREVAFKLALEHYKAECERAKWFVETHPNTKVTVAPIDTYIIRAAVLADTLGTGISKCNVAKKLKHAQAVYDAARVQTELYSAGLSQSKPHDG